MNFPLQLRFKIIAVAPQISVTDATGQEIAFVRQKLFKLKEKINVYSDKTKSTELALLGADRMIDFSARYDFTAPGGTPMGSIKRKGMASLWKAHYQIFPANDTETPDMNFREENPIAKIMDGTLGSIPILGLASGLFFHPRYLITDGSGKELVRLKKHRSWMEARFELHQLSELTPDQSVRIMLSCVLLALLERSRG